MFGPYFCTDFMKCGHFVFKGLWMFGPYFCTDFMKHEHFVFKGLWMFLWFVAFCFMTDKWRKSEDGAPYIHPHGKGTNGIQAAIVFSFFSIFSWVMMILI